MRGSLGSGADERGAGQIYSHWFADAFHDITNGTNPGCGTEGFPAMSGWDPVTGLGVPNPAFVTAQGGGMGAQGAQGAGQKSGQPQR